MKIYLYTDGSCLSNPGGPSGYGVYMMYGSHTRSISEGYVASTNNRMELRAAICALSEIKPGHRHKTVELRSDSKYVTDAINKDWISTWILEGLRRRKNADLWQELVDVIVTFEDLHFIWVKGHSGDQYNEYVDRLANQGAALPEEEQLVDEGFLN